MALVVYTDRLTINRPTDRRRLYNNNLIIFPVPLEYNFYQKTKVLYIGHVLYMLPRQSVEFDILRSIPKMSK